LEAKKGMGHKVALVTGGTRGIGRAIVVGLAKSGAFREIIITGKDAGRGREVLESFAKQGITNVKFFVCDQSDEQSIESGVTAIKTAYPRIDVLVNNAGVLEGKEEGVLETDSKTIVSSFMTNVIGPHKLCQAFVPKMREHKYGRIVNMSSGLAQLTDMASGYFSYRVSKVSVNALTRSLASDLKNDNILVNCMCPGTVKTDMNPTGNRTPEQGADTAIWLALLPDDGPRGGFFRDRAPIPW